MVWCVFKLKNAATLPAVAVIVWGIAVLLAALVGSAFVLAILSDEPNWSEITLALATVVLALATVGLTVAAFFALGSIGEARNARNAVQMTDLSRRWDEETNQHVRYLVKEYAMHGVKDFEHAGTPGPDRLKEVIFKLREDNSFEYRKLMTDPNFLEDIAIMVDYGGIDFDIVDQSLGYNFPYRWSLWKPTIVAFRQEAKIPDLYENFEKLSRRIAANKPQSFSVDESGEIAWEEFKD
jgi:hypothetical protein